MFQNFTNLSKHFQTHPNVLVALTDWKYSGSGIRTSNLASEYLRNEVLKELTLKTAKNFQKTAKTPWNFEIVQNAKKIVLGSSEEHAAAFLREVRCGRAAAAAAAAAAVAAAAAERNV